MWHKSTVLVFLAAIGAVFGDQSGAAAGAAANVTSNTTGWSAYTITPAANSTAGSQLTDTGSAGLKQQLQLRLSEEKLQQYGQSFQDLSVEVSPETESRLHVKVSPTGVKRWEVPQSIVPRPGVAAGLSRNKLMYKVQQPDSEAKSGRPFALTVARRNTLEPIFDTRGHTFIFKDQYIELTTKVPKSADLYGLGETTLSTGLLLPRDGTTITLWARDISPSYPNVNLYGSHPFYLQVNKDGSSHGVLLLNSNGMDVVLNANSLTYRIIGGLIDLYFFLGPSPEAVLRQYHAVIGAPAMAPYWALGLHQSKWGYQNVSVLEQVVANYSAAGLPLESVWVDIEYMASKFKTMTFDDTRFPVSKLRKFVQKLHDAGQSWVPILDPAVSVDLKYRTYKDGTEAGVWMKDYKGSTYVGQVWPGMSVYPDYLAAPNITTWLTKQLDTFYKEVPFDGLWLDMCEPSNFCTGMNCKPDPKNLTAKYWLELHTPKDYAITKNMLVKNRTTCQMTCEAPALTNTLAYPPYKINNAGMLSQNTIHPTARHADNTSEYDAHNLYGTTMAQRHYEAAIAVTGKRPFILTRSTFPGAGRYTAHWSGDNAANWENLFFSIAQIINTNFWGMAMAGADICGYIDMTQDNIADPANLTLSDSDFHQLCNRWTSAGAFYPYSRNHMIIYSRPHEFYRWPDVAAAAKKAFGLRYQLLTYFYSTLFVSHSRGGTMARPLLFTDPSDVRARNATKQWMIGDALLISPVITPNTTSIRPYFTAGNWFSAWDFKRLKVDQGRSIKLEVPYGDVPVHIRGGSILPMQRSSERPALVTRDVRFTPITLVVALPSATASKRPGAVAGAGPLPPYILDEACAGAHRSSSGKLVSCGLLYMDNDTLTVGVNNTLQVWYTAVTAPGGRSGSVENTVLANGGDVKGKLRIEAVFILGVPGTAADEVTATVYGKETRQAEYDAAAGAVKITGLSLDAGQPLVVDWRV